MTRREGARRLLTTARLRETLRGRFLPPNEVTCRLFDGQHLRVVLPEIVGADLHRHGMIEPQVTAVLLDRLRPGMVFIDVGAHYGYYSMIASRLVRSSGRVVAFEPSRYAARLLRRNVRHLEHVVVEQVAVHARTGTVELTDFGPRHSALNTVLGQARVPPEEGRGLRRRVYDVSAVSLDEYTAAHAIRPDVVKLDAEGAEHAILTGMHDLLRTVAPLVVMETGDYDGMLSPPTSACIDLLEDAGYRSFEHDGGLRPHRRQPSYGYGNLFFLPAG